MSQPPLTQRQIDRTYFPAPGQMSESLKRARKPFIWRNRMVGIGVLIFSLGIYAYSISAVQQDDFSDVEDLLPPLEERSAVKSIEDEERERGGPQLKGLKGIPSSISSGSSLANPPPGQRNWGRSSDPSGAGVRGSAWSLRNLAWPGRLNEQDWVRRRGWVEKGTGNVLVWGAPSADNVGSMRDIKPSRGPRMI